MHEIRSTLLSCSQVVNAMDKSRKRSETAVVFPYRVGRTSGKVAKKRPSNAIDMEKLLHFSQQLYAHALTLQEVIRNEGEVGYEALRPRCDQQAAQQFEIFYHTFRQPSGFRKRRAASCE